MKGDTTVSGLIRKRRELGRSIAQHQAEIDRLRLDMGAVDHVLLLWRPEMDVETLVAFGTDNKGSKPGVLARPILAALRMATEPLSVTDIARYVLTLRSGSQEPMTIFRKRVRHSLGNLEARGLVVSRMEAKRTLWEIVR